MKKLEIFKPEDFQSHNGAKFTAQLDAEIANEILNKWLEQNGVKVHGYKSEAFNEQINSWYVSDEVAFTHTALLICIEPIQKNARSTQTVCEGGGMRQYIWYIHENDEIIVSNESPADVVSKDIASFINKEPLNRKIKMSNNNGNVECHIVQNNGINISYVGDL